MRAVLEGIRVVEITSELGAFAGKLLADMGADVVVVEPPGGSPTRHYGPFADGEPDPEKSLYWWHYNTSKRGITLDLDDPQDRGKLRALVGTADVLLECEPADRMATLELDWPDLQKLRPELVMCSINPFGRRGPAAGDVHSTDLTILAKGGPVWSCGYDDHSIPPVRGGGNQGYHIACHYAYLSILTALIHREVSGRGQHIDVSAHAAANVTTEMASYFWLIEQATVQRQTGRHAMDTPSMDTQFQCGDGRWVTTGFPPRTPEQLQWLHDWILEVGSLEEFPEAVFLAQGGQLEEPLDLARIGEDETVTAIFGAAREGLAYAASKVGADEFFVRSQEAGLQTGMILAPEEALEDAHFQAREAIIRHMHPVFGEMRMQNVAPKLSGSPGAVRTPGPELGQHNEEIYGQLLGMSTRHMDELRERGII